jgi:hypothetical protein
MISRLALCALLALASCAREVTAASYDRSCSDAPDCMAILTGDPCAMYCQLAAINVSDRDAWEADWRYTSGFCKTDAGQGVAACAPACWEGVISAHCVDRRCEAWCR